MALELTHNSEKLPLDLARQEEHLLGEEDDPIAMLELYLSMCVQSGRKRFEFCSRAPRTSGRAETYGGRGMAPYCSRDHLLPHGSQSFQRI